MNQTIEKCAFNKKLTISCCNATGHKYSLSPVQIVSRDLFPSLSQYPCVVADLLPSLYHRSRNCPI